MGFAHINQGKDSTIEPAYIAGLVDSSVKPTLENKEVAPSTSQQVVVADEGYDGLGIVTVGAVTAAIDSDIKAENIKKDVEILGVVGTYEGVQTNNAKFIDDGTDILSMASIEYIEIPTGYHSIGNSIFGAALKNIVIPNTVTTIGNIAFQHCTNLETITINKPENSIEGAPWGAPNATVIWTG